MHISVVAERYGEPGSVEAGLLADPRLREPSWLTVASPQIRRLPAAPTLAT